MRRFVRPLSLGLLCLLAACNNTLPADLNTKIDAGEAESALSEITARLKKTPDDEILRALALKAELFVCAAQRCLKEEEGKTRLQAASAQMVKGATLENGIVLDKITIFAAAAPVFATSEEALESLLAARNLAPDAAKTAFENAYFKTLKGLAPAQVEVPLTTLVQSNDAPAHMKHVGGFILAVAQNQPRLKDSYALALRNAEASPFYPAAAGVLAGVLRYQMGEGFLSGLIPTLASYNIPALTKPEPMAAMAAELTLPRTDISSTVLSGSDLNVMALSLTLNPNQPEMWQVFLPAAEAAAARGEPTSFFADLTRFGPLPGSIQSQFLSSLFKVIEGASAQKKPLLPLLKAVENIKLDKANETRLEKLVQTGMNTALEAENLDDALDYGRFKPAIAEANKAKIITLAVARIRTLIKKGQTEDIAELDAVLFQDLGLDFDLDALLLQELAEDMKARGIVAALSTDDPTYLVMQKDAAAIDLGPLFAFAKSYFADKPRELTEQVKTLASGARGVYGLPNALYRMDDAFDERVYPEEERAAYRARALEMALEKDSARTSAERIELIGKLAPYHKGMNLPPLVGALLASNSNLEESRDFWLASSGTARDVLTRTHPQFAALMKGIDAAEAGRWNQAAGAFGTLAKADYAKLVEPYITQLREKLSKIAGVYVAQTWPLPTGAPLMITLSPEALTRATDALSRVSVASFNPIGARAETRPGTYSTDASFVAPLIETAMFDFSQIKLRPGEDVATPSFEKLSLFPSPEDKLPTTLTWEKQGATVTYALTLLNPQGVMLPEGTFSVASHLNEAGKDIPTLLPVGSLLKISQENGEFVGKLYHPATTSPLPVSIAFDAATQTTHLAFAYPLPTSSQPANALAKCQIWPGGGLCGAHHAHSQRNLFTTHVLLTQTSETRKTYEATLQDINAEFKATLPAKLASLPALPSAQNVVDIEAQTEEAVSQTTQAVSATVFVSTTNLLAPPNLPKEE
ncbi:MAG: hypothetical protein COY40_00115 [Alphaproteobacteria bacterium CG_4_10_14_0_8_um_filter_53_9]|nr:MAG: hypothetical protein COY40_00115 [Alphaproteobacteria bacterium CG_4_10_14_0_8_um_filter_53_9]